MKLQNTIFINCLVSVSIAFMLGACSQSDESEQPIVTMNHGAIEQSSDVAGARSGGEVACENFKMAANKHSNILRFAVDPQGTVFLCVQQSLETTGPITIQVENTTAAPVEIVPFEKHLFFHLEGINDGPYKSIFALPQPKTLGPGDVYSVAGDIRDGKGQKLKIEPGDYQMNVILPTGRLGPVGVRIFFYRWNCPSTTLERKGTF